MWILLDRRRARSPPATCWNGTAGACSMTRPCRPAERWVPVRQLLASQTGCIGTQPVLQAPPVHVCCTHSTSRYVVSGSAESAGPPAGEEGGPSRFPPARALQASGHAAAGHQEGPALPPPHCPRHPCWPGQPAAIVSIPFLTLCTGPARSSVACCMHPAAFDVPCGTNAYDGSFMLEGRWPLAYTLAEGVSGPFAHV